MIKCVKVTFFLFFIRHVITKVVFDLFVLRCPRANCYPMLSLHFD